MTASSFLQMRASKRLTQRVVSWIWAIWFLSWRLMASASCTFRKQTISLSEGRMIRRWYYMLLAQQHNLINLLPPHYNMTDGQSQGAVYFFLFFFLIVAQCVIQHCDCPTPGCHGCTLQNGSGPSRKWETLELIFCSKEHLLGHYVTPLGHSAFLEPSTKSRKVSQKVKGTLSSLGAA